jgi:xylulose-5-phosphate/fructose-6-phosphate phosphoketolase
LRTYDRLNVIVAGKQPSPQWLTMQQAATHCDAGIGIWPWAGTEAEGLEP